MRSLAVLSASLSLALLGSTAQPPTASSVEAIDLELPGNAGRVRLQPMLEGTKVASAWDAFLVDWFNFFDRNDDGSLSRQESGRIFAVPSADGRQIAFDFDKCDADKDGKVTLEEMKRFYLDAGFRPVQSIVEPPSLRELQVAEAIFRHLAADGAGILTEGHLKSADRLLRRLDENEDEILAMTEVLSMGLDKFLKAASKSEIQCLPPGHQPVLATISLAPSNAKKPVLQLEEGAAPSVMMIANSNGAQQRIRAGNVVLAFSQTSDFTAKAVANSRLFVVAQFQNVAGSKDWVEMNQLAHDPALQLLADIGPHADRDGDGKLTLKELERFLSLIEKGATCCQVITVSDCGRNLFCHLDTNGDGCLDFQELKAAAGVLTAFDGAKEWKSDQVPVFARVSLGRGQSGGFFGPLPLVKPTWTPPIASKPASTTKAPAWFLAMDLNGDGYLSSGEFLGPVELFRILDTNGDGLISAEEARKEIQ